MLTGDLPCKRRCLLFILDFFENDARELEKAWIQEAEWSRDLLVQGIDVGFVLDRIMHRKDWPAALK